MNKAKGLCFLVACGAVAVPAWVDAAAQASHGAEPALSARQTAVVDRQTARLKSPIDRRVAESWRNAKKIAEFLCRPAALRVLKQRNARIDRVFLGTDAADSLTLPSNRRLTGSGEFRDPKGWHEFTFVCDLDSDAGTVTRFRPIPPPARP